MPIKTTVEEWVETLRTYDLAWLEDQRVVATANGDLFAAALLYVIHEKRANGETIVSSRRAPSRVLGAVEDDLTGRVEIVKCGGKGQTVRIVHPKKEGTGEGEGGED